MTPSEKRKPVTIIGMNIGTCSEIREYIHLMIVKDFIPSPNKGNFFLPCDWLSVDYDTGWIHGEDETEEEEGMTRESVFMMAISDIILSLLTNSLALSSEKTK